MSEHSYTSRREIDQYAFHPAVTLLVPVAAVVAQLVLPRLWSRLEILDLPFIVVLFFSVARRNPITGTITGTLVGLLQDALSNLHIGVNGIAKAIIGYIASSIGFTLVVDNLINRAALSFFSSLLQSLLLFMIARFLEADSAVRLQPLHELLRAVANTVVAIPLFLVLDRFRHHD